jgi:hypothetical protein
MTLSKFIQGLQVFQKYYEEDDYATGAEHDIFYVYPTDWGLSEDDLKKVIELGWFQPDVKYEDEDKFQASDYSPSEGWSTYV